MPQPQVPQPQVPQPQVPQKDPRPLTFCSVLPTTFDLGLYLYLQTKVWGCMTWSEWDAPVAELKTIEHFLA